MKAEEIKVGVTYVNKYESERTVVEIRLGTQKYKRHLMFVEYTTNNTEIIQIGRLKKFASWAVGPKVEVPVHRCKEKTDLVKGFVSVKFKPYDNEWVLSFYGTKCKIVFCPFCGVKLEDPN